jgi:hypothetical protein
MSKKPIRVYNAIYSHWILASWPTLASPIHFLEKNHRKGRKTKKAAFPLPFLSNQLTAYCLGLIYVNVSTNARSGLLL